MTRYAVVNNSTLVTDADAYSMFAAAKCQLYYHCAPAWGRRFMDSVFVPKGGAAPADAYPIYLLDNPDVAGVLGYHAEDPGGKPRLRRHPGIHFNLSHSGRWVACAVHRGPVGLDVEEVRDRNPLPAERVLAPAELRRFAQLRPPAARAFFYRLWTLKESLLKAMGSGLGLDPRRLALDLDGPAVAASLDGAPVQDWTLVPLPMPEGAMGALCHGSRARAPRNP